MRELQWLAAAIVCFAEVSPADYVRVTVLSRRMPAEQGFKLFCFPISHLDQPTFKLLMGHHLPYYEPMENITPLNNIIGVQSSKEAMPWLPSRYEAVVFFVGNRLMMDEGLAPALFDRMVEDYDIPENVGFFDVGCMSLDMIPFVEHADFILTVDAVDGTGTDPGTVLRYHPDDVARAMGGRTSLHELKLADLFDAAVLMGATCEGLCLGIQVENMEPAEYTVDLTDPVKAGLPLLEETIVAELYKRGYVLNKRS